METRKVEHNHLGVCSEALGCADEFAPTPRKATQAAKPKVEHTPTPWSVDFWLTNRKKTIRIGPRQEEGGSPIIETIAIVPVKGETYSDTEAANAALIVHRVNMFDELVKALRWAELEISQSCDLPDSNGRIVAPDSILRVKLAKLQELISRATESDR